MRFIFALMALLTLSSFAIANSPLSEEETIILKQLYFTETEQVYGTTVYKIVWAGVTSKNITDAADFYSHLSQAKQKYVAQFYQDMAIRNLASEMDQYYQIQGQLAQGQDPGENHLALRKNLGNVVRGARVIESAGGNVSYLNAIIKNNRELFKKIIEEEKL